MPLQLVEIDPTRRGQLRDQLAVRALSQHDLSKYLASGVLVFTRSAASSQPSLRCRTDGIFVWSETLADYVRRHDLGLDRDFLDHVARTAAFGPESLPLSPEVLQQARSLAEQLAKRLDALNA